MREMKILTVLAAAAVVAGAWTPVFGSSLVSIGVLDPTDGTTAYSEIRAVSQDGSYVVGTSQAPGGTIRVPVVWSAADGLVALPNPSGANSVGIGVAVGVGGNAGNICIVGLHEGNLTHRYYIAPLTSLASGSWVDCASAGGWPTSDLRGGAYNDLRNAVPDNAGWPPLGNWYTGSIRSGGRDARLRADLNISGWDGTTVRTTYSVSAYGVMVGRSVNDGLGFSSAFYEVVNVGFYAVPGSTGYRADGIGISSSFGKNEAGDYDVQWISGQVLNYNGTSAQAFRWKLGDASMTGLGTLPGDASSVAYTVADNGVTAGYSYLGTGTPTTLAVVWDTSGIWDTTGQAVDIKAKLAADGVDVSGWSYLNRVFAASDDGSVLAGYGIWAADSSTRGFVAVKTVVRITNITVSGGTVTIGFTSNSTSDTPANFALQHCTVVNGTYTDVAATITGSAGSFQATLSTSGDAQFYRIRWHP